MKELSGYVFSPLREGDIALYRGPATAWRRSCLSPRKNLARFRRTARTRICAQGRT